MLEIEFAKELFQSLKQARKLAQQNVKKAQHQQKQSYNRSARARMGGGGYNQEEEAH